MHVLVIGSGGREHALCWKLAQSSLLSQLYCAPGNPGIAALATCVPLDVADHAAVVAFCRQHRIDLVVVGPEAPLVAGLADTLKAANIACFGPSAAAAQLEGSKGFTKDLCAAHHIPTAAYARFTSPAAALAYLDAHPAPIVIKYDGLAAGKGVIVAMSDAQARAAVGQLLSAPGDALVIEAFLEGEEASLFALVDGQTALPLASAQDHKRVGDGDTGPNTGGMGAYSPAPVLTPALTEQAMAQIIRPTVAAMAAAGTPYVGVLYAGLMLTKDGPQLIEYNCRFGDPETQVLMPRLKSDLLPALLAAVDGQLAHVDLRWHDDAALTVVMAAQGYPGTPVKGTRIAGIDDAEAVSGVTVFHAGTARDETGALVAHGGRVLNVTALAPSIAQAQAHAYAAVDRIDWPGGFCRRDIGWRALP
jgi:phosphoribosylamine---glycine ligase